MKLMPVKIIYILVLLLLLCGMSAAFAGTVPVPKIKFTAAFEGADIKDPVSLAIDESNGDLIIANSGKSEILILDKSGNLREKIGRAEDVTGPYGVAVDQKGRIFLSDLTGDSIKIFSPAGSLVSTITLQGEDGSDIRPGRMAAWKGNDLYVVDRKNHYIYVVDDEGKSRLIIKTKKEKKQQMLQDVAVDESGNIYCVNSLGPAVNIFGPDGQYLNSFGSHSAAEDGFSFPTGISIDAKGRAWIVDSFQHKLKVFDSKGRFLSQFGGVGTTPGKFFFPIDIAFGKDGSLYVLEKGGSRVQVFQVEDLK